MQGPQAKTEASRPDMVCAGPVGLVYTMGSHLTSTEVYNINVKHELAIGHFQHA